MSNTVSKIEFPRNSPDGLIATAKALLKTHDKDAAKAAVPPQVTDRIRKFSAEAEALRTEAKELISRAVQLNSAADQLLGTGIGQSLSNSETLAGSVADFRDHASLTFKDNIEQLKEYGFSVTISQKAGRISEKRAEMIRAKKP